MVRLAMLIALSLSVLGCAGLLQSWNDTTPGKKARPIAAIWSYDESLSYVTTTDPWTMSIRSSSPHLVAYDDGTVIYRRELEPGIYEYVQTVDSAFVAQVSSSGGQLEGLSESDRWVWFGEGTSLPVTHVWISSNGSDLYARIDGLSTVSKSGRAELVKAKQMMESELYELVNSITNYSSEEAERWVIHGVELTVDMAGHSELEAVRWPQGLPRPGSRFSDCYTRYGPCKIVIPGEERVRLAGLMSQIEDGRPVEIQGRSWYVNSGSVRIVFPLESAWELK